MKNKILCLFVIMLSFCIMFSCKQSLIDRTVTVTFDPNGGNFDGSTSSIVMTGKPGDILGIPTNISHEGFYFMGWNPDVPAVFPDEDTTYFALWEKIPLSGDDDFNVNDIVSFGISSWQNKVDYFIGDTFDPSGLDIEICYSDGTSKVISYNDNPSLFSFSVTEFTSDMSSTVDIHIYFNNCYVYTCSVNLLDAEVSGGDNSEVQVISLPTKLNYATGQVFDASGLVIKVTEIDGSEKTISYEDNKDAFSFYPSEFTSDIPTGKYTVVVSYNDNVSYRKSFYIEIDFTSKPIYSFDEATGTLTISGNTGDFHYSSNIAPWITEYGEKIKKVVIEEGVTKLGKYAFYELKNLTEVQLSNSLESIGYSVFYGCENLTTLDLPVNLKYVYDLAFSYSGITELIFPEGMKEIPDMKYTKNLKKIEIPNTVTEIGSFYGCSSLESIVIPDSVNNFYADFSNCTSLKTCVLPDSLFGGKFDDCSSLEEIIIPSGKIIYPGFENCTSLKSVTIGENVTEISSWVFRNCPVLETVHYNAIEVIYDEEVVDDGCFTNCGWESEGITLYIGNKVKKIRDKFLKVPTGATESSKFKTLIWEENSVCESLGDEAFLAANFIEPQVFSLFPKSLKYFGSYCLYQCNLVGEIVIRDDYIIEESAFGGNNLSGSLIFPANFELQEGIFYGAGTFTELVLPTDIEEIPDWCFSDALDCYIDLPSSVKKIGKAAFRGATNAGLPLILPEGLEEIESWAFADAGISGQLKIPESCKIIRDGAFFCCSEITEVILPREMEELGLSKTYIYCYTDLNYHPYYDSHDYDGPLDKWNRAYAYFSGNGVFSACLNLEKVVLPEYLESIGDDCFSCTPKLKTIDSWPTNLKVIGYNSFSNYGGFYKIDGSEYNDIYGYVKEGMAIAEFPNTLEYVMENSFHFVEFCSEVKFNSKLKYFAGFDLYYCKGNFDYIKIPITENIGVNPFGIDALTIRVPYENYVFVIPEGLENIEIGAFQFWGENTTIFLPSTLKTLDYSLGNSVFKAWTVSSNNVVFCSEIPPAQMDFCGWMGQSTSFDSSFQYYTCVKAEIIYVPDESLELYKQQWTEDKGFFYDEIKGLSELPDELKQYVNIE